MFKNLISSYIKPYVKMSQDLKTKFHITVGKVTKLKACYPVEPFLGCSGTTRKHKESKEQEILLWQEWLPQRK